MISFSIYHISPNYVLSDIAHALKWIETEITAFGGDPNKLTLMGHSGGGALAKLVAYFSLIFVI